MNKSEIVISNLLGILLLLILSLFKVSALRRQMEFWVNSFYLNLRSFFYTLR